MSVFILYFVCTAVISLIATGTVTKFLRHKNIMDLPNHRSSHTIPTPRGGGIGMMLAALAGLASLPFVYEAVPAHLWHVIIGAVLLCVLSFLDDIYQLSPRLRFGLQIALIIAIVFIFDFPNGLILGGYIPEIAEKILIVMGWVWFINLFNFMDGIDGISANQIISVCVGVGLIAIFFSLPESLGAAAVILVGAALGFLRWNWHKAQVFMGDVGSIPSGFLLGWLLLEISAQGFFISALIIALYYLMDATITLFKRLMRREKIWQAHREHFYQQGVDAGQSHDQVVLKIAGLNICLIICAMFVPQGFAWLALGAGLALTAGLLWHFKAKA